MSICQSNLVGNYALSSVGTVRACGTHCRVAVVVSSQEAVVLTSCQLVPKFSDVSIWQAYSGVLLTQATSFCSSNLSISQCNFTGNFASASEAVRLQARREVSGGVVG